MCSKCKQPRTIAVKRSTLWIGERKRTDPTVQSYPRVTVLGGLKWIGPAVLETHVLDRARRSVGGVKVCGGPGDGQRPVEGVRIGRVTGPRQVKAKGDNVAAEVEGV